MGPVPERVTSKTFDVEAEEEMVTEHVSFSKAFVSVVLSATLGAVLGFAIDYTQLELPFFVDEVLLGAICAVFTTFAAAMFVEMPDWQRYKRLGPAVGFGSVVGVALFFVWYAFDPPYGFVAIGGIAGLCAGFPIAVSFGMLGGESRPLGGLEFMNLLVGFLVGGVLGLIAIEDFGFEGCLGAAGMAALIPTLFGGRVNLYQVLAEINATLNSGND